MRIPDSTNILKVFIALPVIILLMFSVNYEVRTNDHRSPAAKNKILLDQLGYRPSDLKVAFVRTEKPDTFLIVDAVNKIVMYEGKFSSMEFDRSTGDYLYALDFSTFSKPGMYEIIVPAIAETSYEFSIDKSVYNDCFTKTLMSFYYQRCGIEINNGTQWHHPVCHLNPALFIDDPSKELNATGGWHDAGDYNKFVPTTAVSAAFLLYTYENNPDFFYDGQLNIPESNNSIPDILDEAGWALNWLLKMQREDGAVYHKVSIKKWTAENLPEEETDKQYVFGISSTSTADVAAVTALGARLIAEYDKKLSLQLLRCAVSAWNFLEKHPDNFPQGGFKNPFGVEGGEYGDETDADERLWASIELYRLTGSEPYLNYFLSNYQKVGGPNYAVSWKNTENFSYYSFMKLHPLFQIEAREVILSNINTYGDGLVNRADSGYKCVLNNDEYYWGSNSTVAGYTFDLINLYQITKKRKYIKFALDQFHYLLGRNTFSISFITGVGSNPVRYPYHQFSMLKYSGNPVPGLLVAGPNSYSKLNGKIISDIPGKCYEDYEKNYYVNEVAINYTAPLVYISSYFTQSGENDISNKNYIQRDSGME